MTLFGLLEEGTEMLEQSGSPDAKRDARELLMTAFGLDMTHFLLDRMQALPDDEKTAGRIEEYRSMIGRRRMRVPLQQILGSQEFMGLNFYVNEHVLIPRQDTETLVEQVLKEQQDREKSLLDLCTGSGCIAVSLAVKGGYRSVTATDISEKALETARRNAASLCGDGTEIRFYQGDLFAALPEKNEKFDIITANPPYIPTAVIATLEPEVRDHEPVLALDGTEDGLYFYRRIAAEAKPHLSAGGAVYLEIGYDQGEQVREIFENAGYQSVRVVKDLPGRDRVVCARFGEGIFGKGI